MQSYKMSQDRPIYCPSCGERNPGDSVYCMSCGTSIKRRKLSNPTTQGRTEGQAAYHPRYQQPISGQGTFTETKLDPPNPIIYICSLCIPILGIVFYFHYREDYPNKARDILILGVASIIIYILANI